MLRFAFTRDVYSVSQDFGAGNAALASMEAVSSYGLKRNFAAANAAVATVALGRRVAIDGGSGFDTLLSPVWVAATAPL